MVYSKLIVGRPPHPGHRFDREAVVVGAGAAGVAAAAELGRRGVDVLAIDRGMEVGGSWDRRYEDLRLNTVRWLSAPRHSRIPRSAGRWPSRETFVSHLRSYAKRERIDVELGTEVRRIERRGSGYAVDTSSGPRSARFVVIATGYDRIPVLPEWPGQARFKGQLIHASEYRSARDFRGRDVLVVGTGNTGTEIATQLSQRGAALVRVSVRTPPNIVPLEALGIPITFFARFGELQPTPFVDWFGALLQRLAWGDLSRHGLLAAPYGIGTELRVKGLGPVVDRGFVGTLKAGDIGLVPAVAGFDEDGVLLADDRRIEPEVVIAATGYRHDLERLVGHLGVLTPAGKPLCLRGETSPTAPGLYFSGFWLPASGQLPAMRRTTARIGREVARLKRRGDCT